MKSFRRVRYKQLRLSSGSGAIANQPALVWTCKYCVWHNDECTLPSAGSVTTVHYTNDSTTASRQFSFYVNVSLRQDDRRQGHNNLRLDIDWKKNRKWVRKEFVPSTTINTEWSFINLRQKYKKFIIFFKSKMYKT